MNNSITVETMINAPIDLVWDIWTKPNHITKWCFASDDWEVPHAENDLRVNGNFKTRMSAKNKSAGFDFEGKYTNVEKNKLIEYIIFGDSRRVKIKFTQTPKGIKVSETFEMENENSEELQRNGWQSILNNFKKYVEKNYR